MTVVEEKEVMAEALPAPVEQSSNPADVTAPVSHKPRKSNRSEGGDDTKKPRKRFQGNYVPYEVLIRQHEEMLAKKKVLETGVKGTVLWFSFRYHYGFISRDDGKGHVFVHQMNIVKSRMRRVYLRSLANNEKVEFDVIEGNSGPEAANVTGPDGADVQGFACIFLRRSSKGHRRDRSIESKDESREEHTLEHKDKSPKQRRRRSNNKKSDERSNKTERRNRRKRNDSSAAEDLVKKVENLNIAEAVSGGDAKVSA